MIQDAMKEWSKKLSLKNCKNIHSSKKQENNDNLTRPFNNQIMYLAILMFGGKLCYFLERFKSDRSYDKLVIFKVNKFESCYQQSQSEKFILQYQFHSASNGAWFKIVELSVLTHHI